MPKYFKLQMNLESWPQSADYFGELLCQHLSREPRKMSLAKENYEDIKGIFNARILGNGGGGVDVYLQLSDDERQLEEFFAPLAGLSKSKLRMNINPERQSEVSPTQGKIMNDLKYII